MCTVMYGLYGLVRTLPKPSQASTHLLSLNSSLAPHIYSTQLNMLDQKKLITSMREVAIVPVRDIAVEDLDMIMRAEGIDAMSYQD